MAPLSDENRREGPSVAFSLELDGYEIVNLREGLHVLRMLHCDTGDWMGQILMKLPELSKPVPNVPALAQIERVKSSPPILNKVR